VKHVLVKDFRMPAFIDTSRRQFVRGCGPQEERLVEMQLWEPGRNAEFSALVHKQTAPCKPQQDTHLWSCVRYLSEEQIATRESTLWGFHRGEEGIRKVKVNSERKQTYSQTVRIKKSGFLFVCAWLTCCITFTSSSHGRGDWSKKEVVVVVIVAIVAIIVIALLLLLALLLLCFLLFVIVGVCWCCCFVGTVGAIPGW
jgi:hypothetical protein